MTNFTTQSPSASEVFSQSGEDFKKAMHHLGSGIIFLFIGMGLTFYERWLDIKWGIKQFKGWMAYHRYKISTNKAVLGNRVALFGGWGMATSYPAIFLLLLN